MAVMVFCDAMARGWTSAALNIPPQNAAVYNFFDIAVSYGVFLRLHPDISAARGYGLSRAVVSLPVASALARIAGCFAGFTAAWVWNCPVRPTDAVWMSIASTVTLVLILFKREFSR